jgi:hypothetical protein
MAASDSRVPAASIIPVNSKDPSKIMRIALFPITVLPGINVLKTHGSALASHGISW